MLLRNHLSLLGLMTLFALGGACDEKPGMDMPSGDEITEKTLDVKLALTQDTLRISVRDGQIPVMTDVWLYTIEDGKLAPLTAFMDPSSRRKSRRRMLPCSLSGAASGLIPCDNGEENGLMTDAARVSRTGTATPSAIDGDVEVKLGAVPTRPVAVLAALEDQRYAGGAAIDPSGKAVALPMAITPERHRARSFASDIKPLLTKAGCTTCHGAGGVAAKFPLASYEDTVMYDFGYEEAREACAQMFPSGPGRIDCESKITDSEYMVEPGAPALSPLLRRTRPDEMKSVSPEGLKWYGSAGKRFGASGDRRMPPQNITMDPADDRPDPSYFDDHAAEYQVLFDWVAQGAPR